ncbi:hypothetical protein [Pseudomonas protegens]|uniref:hypothetical protein n=1 Tax=Pseudomonas protegens TaxID=380021 RepID=UPI000B072A27|nr:hypothetical protein [Pseudomonas protegens]MDX9680013.1 hypothetical protein [Pseudomonas protegens]
MTDLPNTPLAWVNGSDAPEKSAIDLGFAAQHRPSTGLRRPRQEGKSQAKKNPA